MKTNSFEMNKILDTLREFIDKEVIPHEPLLLNHEYDNLMVKLDEKRKTARSLGFWLPQIPREYGGMGLSLVEHGQVSETPSIRKSYPMDHFLYFYYEHQKLFANQLSAIPGRRQPANRQTLVPTTS
jgi:alkylation response protein AidB-like acyl-CoA dehydrogenase